MKNRTFRLPVAVLALAVICSTPSLAADGHKGKGMNRPTFEYFDRDGDGRITNEEFYEARSERIAQRVAEGRKMKNLANAPSFDDIDADDDGFVSPEEFSTHQAEHHGKRHHK